MDIGTRGTTAIGNGSAPAIDGSRTIGHIEEQLARLPDTPNVVFMTGMKFGSTGQEALTWAMNAHLPALVCQRYRRSRIVAFSTGNVYGLTPVTLGGSMESDPPRPVPVSPAPLLYGPLQIHRPPLSDESITV